MGLFPLIIRVEPHEYSVDEFKKEPFSEPTSKELQAQKLNSPTMPPYSGAQKY